MLAPLLGQEYWLDTEALLVLTAALLLGTPILSLLGAIGAALTLGLRGGGSLLALLILPLYVPVLIFGAGAVDAVHAGLGATANLSLLGAGLLIAIVGAPFAAVRCRPHRAGLMNYYRYAAPMAFYPLAGKLVPWFAVGAAIFALAGLWIGFAHRAHRFPAGGSVPDHLHPRARRMDVDVHLPGDGVLERAVARRSTRGCRR